MRHPYGLTCLLVLLPGFVRGADDVPRTAAAGHHADLSALGRYRRPQGRCMRRPA